MSKDAKLGIRVTTNRLAQWKKDYEDAKAGHISFSEYVRNAIDKFPAWVAVEARLATAEKELAVLQNRIAHQDSGNLQDTIFLFICGAVAGGCVATFLMLAL